MSQCLYDTDPGYDTYDDAYSDDDIYDDMPPLVDEFGDIMTMPILHHPVVAGTRRAMVIALGEYDSEDDLPELLSDSEDDMPEYRKR